jgi:hypothetical protein
MVTRDRRSGTERRASSRFAVEVDVEWQGAGNRMPGSISDVSLDGCYVLSAGEVADGESIRLFVPLADGMKVELSGHVANHVYDIGFGLKFDQLSAAQRDVLGALVRQFNP